MFDICISPLYNNKIFFPFIKLRKIIHQLKNIDVVIIISDALS